MLRNIDLQRTAERSFPSWKGPSGVGCKPDSVTHVEIHQQKWTPQGAEATPTFVRRWPTVRFLIQARPDIQNKVISTASPDWFQSVPAECHRCFLPDDASSPWAAFSSWSSREDLWEVSLNLDTPPGQTSRHYTSATEKITINQTAISL